jgi:hypothetical protein
VYPTVHTDTVNKSLLKVEKNAAAPPTTDDPKAWNDYLAAVGLSVNAGKFLSGAPFGKGLAVRLTENIAVSDADATDDLRMIMRAGVATSTNREPDLTTEKKGDGSVPHPIRFGSYRGKVRKMSGFILDKEKEK